MRDGFWKEDCIQRAFVEGAKWWQFHHNGSTMFGSERDDAEVEAVKRYGEPEVAGTPTLPHGVKAQEPDLDGVEYGSIERLPPTGSQCMFCGCTDGKHYKNCKRELANWGG